LKLKVWKCFYWKSTLIGKREASDWFGETVLFIEMASPNQLEAALLSD